jgi:hypothetical protein
VEVRQGADEVEEGRDLEQEGVHQRILNHPRGPEQAGIPEVPGIPRYESRALWNLWRFAGPIHARKLTRMHE